MSSKDLPAKEIFFVSKSSGFMSLERRPSSNGNQNGIYKYDHSVKPAASLSSLKFGRVKEPNSGLHHFQSANNLMPSGGAAARAMTNGNTPDKNGTTSSEEDEEEGNKFIVNFNSTPNNSDPFFKFCFFEYVPDKPFRPVPYPRDGMQVIFGLCQPRLWLGFKGKREVFWSEEPTTKTLWIIKYQDTTPFFKLLLDETKEYLCAMDNKILLQPNTNDTNTDQFLFRYVSFHPYMDQSRNSSNGRISFHDNGGFKWLNNIFNSGTNSQNNPKSSTPSNNISSINLPAAYTKKFPSLRRISSLGLASLPKLHKAIQDYQQQQQQHQDPNYHNPHHQRQHSHHSQYSHPQQRLIPRGSQHHPPVPNQFSPHHRYRNPMAQQKRNSLPDPRPHMKSGSPPLHFRQNQMPPGRDDISRRRSRVLKSMSTNHLPIDDRAMILYRGDHPKEHQQRRPTNPLSSPVAIQDSLGRKLFRTPNKHHRFHMKKAESDKFHQHMAYFYIYKADSMHQLKSDASDTNENNINNPTRDVNGNGNSNTNDTSTGKEMFLDLVESDNVRVVLKTCLSETYLSLDKKRVHLCEAKSINDNCIWIFKKLPHSPLGFSLKSYTAGKYLVSDGIHLRATSTKLDTPSSLMLCVPPSIQQAVAQQSIKPPPQRGKKVMLLIVGASSTAATAAVAQAILNIKRTVSMPATGNPSPPHPPPQDQPGLKLTSSEPDSNQLAAENQFHSNFTSNSSNNHTVDHSNGLNEEMNATNHMNMDSGQLNQTNILHDHNNTDVNYPNLTDIYRNNDPRSLDPYGDTHPHHPEPIPSNSHSDSFHMNQLYDDTGIDSFPGENPFYSGPDTIHDFGHGDFQANDLYGGSSFYDFYQGGHHHHDTSWATGLYDSHHAVDSGFGLWGLF